ncbi:hypothetical protein Bca101_007820 [Brassica carinata]
MASLRCLRELSRRATTVLSINQTRLISSVRRLELPGTSITHGIPSQNRSLTRDSPWYRSQGRHFSSKTKDTDESSEGEDDDDEDYEEVEREYSPAEKVEAAAEIGYKVMGPLKPSERLFKPYESVFAVVQIGSHQFKVSNGDSIFTEKLKFCDINDKLVLTKVLLLGSASQTIIGRPILPDATVHAVVEEHVFVFGSFTEHETRSLLEQKPINPPQSHKEKSVKSIQFGSFNPVAENSPVNSANGELKKGQTDEAVKSRPSSSLKEDTSFQSALTQRSLDASRPSSSHKEDKSFQSAESQKRLGASRPSSSDKINDNAAKKLSGEHVEENGIIKEVSERKPPLNNGVAEKAADPIGLEKLCVSDGESDSLCIASSSKFQALDTDIFSNDSSSGTTIPRKNSQMVPTESIPPMKDFTPRGLINAGNLCFLNATLQALLSCSPFVQLLQGIQLQNIPKAESPTLAAFSEFISELDVPSSSSFRNNVAVVESGRPFTPAMFEGVLRNFTPDVLNNMSGRPRQEDAQEFLSFIMDQMHDELLKLRGVSPKLTASKSSVVSSANEDDEWETVGPKNKSAVTRTQSFVPSQLSDIFGGQLRSVVKAKGILHSLIISAFIRHLLNVSFHGTGNKDSATVQPYLLLHLDILPEAVSTIEDALHLFSAPEDLEGYRASVTGKAGVVSARKSIKIQKLSKIMILHLMRFSYGNQGSTKLHKRVHFPLDLNLGRYLLVSPSNGGLKYELVATITHHGRDPSKGHYTTDARRKNNQWLRFDDASVTAIGTKQVLHDQAYVLFYKQV